MLKSNNSANYNLLEFVHFLLKHKTNVFQMSTAWLQNCSRPPVAILNIDSVQHLRIDSLLLSLLTSLPKNIKHYASQLNGIKLLKCYFLILRNIIKVLI